MQTNYIFKIKEFLKRIFSKKTEIKEEKIDEPEELVASGFTIAPKQYTSIYKKNKELQ